MVGRIEVISPVRVDLAGGWTDLAPFTFDHGGEVVNFTINRYIRAVRESVDSEIVISSDAPFRSGLGTSGSVNVCKSAIMSGGDVDDLERIAENAYQLEISEGNRCGRQDQWAAAFGGFNRFVFIRDKVEIMPFEAMNSSKNFLRKHLLLVDSGIKHNSGSIQDGVWSRYDNGDSEVHEGLQIIRLASRKMVDGIQRDQRHLVVESLIETCRGVDLINTEIHDPFREVIKPLLAEKSVMGWKALGAGAGGIAALLCSPIGIKLARDAMNSAGWEILEWDFEENGVQVL